MQNLELWFASKESSLSVRSFSVVEEMSSLFTRRASLRMFIRRAERLRGWPALLWGHPVPPRAIPAPAA